MNDEHESKKLRRRIREFSRLIESEISGDLNRRHFPQQPGSTLRKAGAFNELEPRIRPVFSPRYLSLLIFGHSTPLY